MNVLNILRVTGWTLIALVLILLLGFAERQQDMMLCRGAEINILPDKGESFISEKALIGIVAGDSLARFRNMPVTALNPGELEARLEQNPYIRNAEVFVDIAGTLKIDVYQRQPLLRIFKPSSTGFYIDEQGWKMPLSAVYTAPVLLASGNIKEQFSGVDSVQTEACRELFQLATFIRKHEFWSRQISNIWVDENNQFVLYPYIGDHKIVFGGAENLEDKFTRLWLFYRKALVKVGWDRYRVINLKYTGQIVCEK